MKKYLLLFLLSGCSITVYADDTANTFALQAGNIAGAAEQCGQDVTTLTARSKEAINAITPIPSEEATANSIFDKAVADALATQSTVIRKISCSDVLTTYNSLPLLRSDYKQSVIAVLAAHRHVQTAAPIVQAQQLVTAQSQSEASVTNQVQTLQPDQAQPDSSIQSALSNEMPIGGNSVQNYVSADNNSSQVNNNVASTNNSIPSTATPSSDIISVTQAFNQGNSNWNSSAGSSQNSIANTP